MTGRQNFRATAVGIACLILGVVAFGIRGMNPGYGTSVEASVILNLALVLGGIVLLVAGIALLVKMIVSAATR